ncbi:hypothetical protein V6N12_050339 [Hibiscus sabdariffa]|uniref:Uncharacterized protein n=1 Tax=Hibiscus sabdariffa TaxID=183260 RepID=A0ABR2GC39_9ROSI
MASRRKEEYQKQPWHQRLESAFYFFVNGLAQKKLWSERGRRCEQSHAAAGCSVRQGSEIGTAAQQQQEDPMQLDVVGWVLAYESCKKEGRQRSGIFPSTYWKSFQQRAQHCVMLRKSMASKAKGRIPEVAKASTARIYLLFFCERSTMEEALE